MRPFSVGSNFQTFVTPSDYFANAILWLPITLILIYIWINWQELKAPPLPNRTSWKSWIFPSVVLVLIPLLWFFFGTMIFPHPILLSGIYLWAILLRYIFPVNDSDTAALFATLRRIVQFAIPIAAATFVFGFIDGNNDLRSYRNPYIFHMKDDNQDELRIVLRNFDKGVLVRDPVKGRVEFIRWENVISIGRIAVATQNVPLSCYWLGLGCGEVVTP